MQFWVGRHVPFIIKRWKDEGTMIQTDTCWNTEKYRQSLILVTSNEHGNNKKTYPRTCNNHENTKRQKAYTALCFLISCWNKSGDAPGTLGPWPPQEATFITKHLHKLIFWENQTKTNSIKYRRTQTRRKRHLNENPSPEELSGGKKQTNLWGGKDKHKFGVIALRSCVPWARWACEGSQNARSAS